MGFSIKRYMNYDVNIVKKIERYYMLCNSNRKTKQLLGKLLFNRTKKISSCNIYPTIKMGKNIYVAHPTGITLGETSELGSNIILYPGVQLVSNFASDERKNGRRHPKIENNCILCVNSIVVGTVTVGANSIVGAGAIVTHDVPKNTIVTGTNQFRPNRYQNIEFLQMISENTNKDRIMFFDKPSLISNNSVSFEKQTGGENAT